MKLVNASDYNISESTPKKETILTHKLNILSLKPSINKLEDDIPLYKLGNNKEVQWLGASSPTSHQLFRVRTIGASTTWAFYLGIKGDENFL